ncbi:hypothetical protein [Flavobacterium pedocola]
MKNLIFKTPEILILESFDFGHSTLRFKGLDNENIVVEFQGMSYIEIPRFLNGVEIWEQEENEQMDFIKKRPKLQDNTNFWKMISDNEVYNVAGLGIKIYK